MNFLKRGSAQRARNERCEQPPKTGEGSIKSTFCEINYFSVLVYGDCERQDWFIRIARRVSPRGCGLCRAKRTPREQLEITSVLGSIKCVMIITKLSLALKFEFKNILEVLLVVVVLLLVVVVLLLEKAAARPELEVSSLVAVLDKSKLIILNKS
jgi:hypothetical protein